MGEKRYTTLYIILSFVILAGIAFISIQIVSKPYSSSIQSNEFISQTKQNNPKARPGLSLYPEITGINITDNDNISLYASSGDGQSHSTAYIIENISIVNPADNYSLYIYDVSDFLIIRNLQIFSSNIYAISVIQCSNISFENITVQNDGSLVNFFYGIYFDHCSSIQFSNASIYDTIDISITYCTDSVFDNVIFYDIYRYSFTGIRYCENITLSNNTINQEIQYDHNEIWIYDSNDIKILDNYCRNNGFHLEDCDNIEILGNSLINYDVGFYDSDNILIRENNLEESILSFAFCSYGQIEQNQILMNEGSDKVLYFRSSTNFIITHNTIIANVSILYFSGSINEFFFEYNTVECDGEYIVEYYPFNLNEISIRIDLSIRYNRFSGTYSHFYSSIRKSTHFFALFTNVFAFNILLFADIALICIFSIVVIFLLRSQSSNLMSETSEIELWDLRKLSFRTIPIIVGSVLTILTSTLTTRRTLISSVLIRWGFLDEKNIIILHLSILILLWLAGLGFVIPFMLRSTHRSSNPFEHSEPSKKIIIKTILIPVITAILLFYPLQLFFVVYSRWVVTFFFSILLIVMSLGFGKDLETVRLKRINVALLGIFFLVDFVLTMLIVTKDPVPTLLEKPAGFTLGVLLKILYIIVSVRLFLTEKKYHNEDSQRHLTNEKPS